MLLLFTILICLPFIARKRTETDPTNIRNTHRNTHSEHTTHTTTANRITELPRAVFESSRSQAAAAPQPAAKARQPSCATTIHPKVREPAFEATGNAEVCILLVALRATATFRFQKEHLSIFHPRRVGIAAYLLLRPHFVDASTRLMCPCMSSRLTGHELFYGFTGRTHATCPVRSGPVRSDPAGPVRSGPVRSGPIRPVRPVRSRPVRSGPVRSGPVRSGPIRPVRPVRSGPVWSGPAAGPGC